MSELDGTRKRVVQALKKLDAFAVENSVHAGTPDVNYIEGWIELKWLRSWPVRQDTVVHIEHYSPQQRVFAIRRRRRGGNCWMLLQVRNQWLLFDAAVAAEVFNKSTAKELFEAAHRVWPNGLDDEEFRECVSQPQKPYIFNVAGSV